MTKKKVQSSPVQSSPVQSLVQSSPTFPTGPLNFGQTHVVASVRFDV